ncbi:MAG: hypothetical protein GX601_06410 [Anaerolineales bacterium]|nr:hypothetical protein [Anaerolineales bacterium]
MVANDNLSGGAAARHCAISGTASASLTHNWLRRVSVAFVPGPRTPLLEQIGERLLGHFRKLGHRTQPAPDDSTDVILTTARFDEPLGWRKALLFVARARFKLAHAPVIYTMVHLTPQVFGRLIEHFRVALSRDPIRSEDFTFAGLAPQAYQVLVEQGRRGGPMLALMRLLQAQAKCIRILLVVGEEQPEAAYHFDLVGGYPRSDAADPEAFYDDLVLRIVTAVSTHEVTQHEVVGEPVSRTLWQQLTTPTAMYTAARELGRRNFFTEAVRIADLVSVPAVSDAVASQYSEGCFATWDPQLGALIATVTGSARPVNKGEVTENDLAVIVGVRPGDDGALVRCVEGKTNNPPSSEAVEMVEIDRVVPKVILPAASGPPVEVPALRSKLHGHRGVGAYHPDWVEYLPLSPAYHHYPVSCATEAQARGIAEAFARSEALRNPDDPRQVVFTVLPCHGAVIAERWAPGMAPFQLIWEYMDAGYLQVESTIPQGPMTFVHAPDGRMRLQVLYDGGQVGPL